MRSAFIIASLALTALAAPVPVTEQAPARRDIAEDVAPLETFLDKRFQRTSDGGLINSRSVEIIDDTLSAEDEDVHEEKRAHRGPSRRSVEEEDEDVEEVLEKRAHRGPAGRSVEVEEKRAHRGPAGRSVEVEEKRAHRGPAGRSVEVEEKRAHRGPAGRSVEAKNTIRNIYDGVVGIVEALKTRGFSSANTLPLRQPM